MSRVLPSPGTGPAQKAVPGSPAFTPEVAVFHSLRRLSSHPGMDRLFETTSQRVDVDRGQLVYPSLRALERKLITHPRHELGPGNPGGVVGAGVCMCAAAIAGGVPGLSVPAGHGIALPADVPDRQSGDARPQRVVWRKHPVVAMPVLPRLRDEIGASVNCFFPIEKTHPFW